MTKVT